MIYVKRIEGILDSLKKRMLNKDDYKDYKDFLIRYDPKYALNEKKGRKRALPRKPLSPRKPSSPRKHTFPHFESPTKREIESRDSSMPDMPESVLRFLRRFKDRQTAKFKASVPPFELDIGECTSPEEEEAVDRYANTASAPLLNPLIEPRIANVRERARRKLQEVQGINSEMKKLSTAPQEEDEHAEKLFRLTKGNKITELYWLLKAFPHLVNVKDQMHQTALLWAVKGDHRDETELLLMMGADAYSKDIF